jgi:hypothetical protein
MQLACLSSNDGDSFTATAFAAELQRIAGAAVDVRLVRVLLLGRTDVAALGEGRYRAVGAEAQQRSERAA